MCIRDRLVAAGNPCPCGFAGDPERSCVCPESRLAAYRARLSGPLLDRVALSVDVPRVDPGRLGTEHGGGESTAAVAERARAARERARNRDRGDTLTPDARRCFAEGARRAGLTARACGQVVAVARTIADLADEARVGAAHVEEAFTFQRVGPYG